jgi:polar amino acid transport system permease protein
VNVFDILVTYKPAFLTGLRVTLELCLIIWSVGLIAGALLGISSSRWRTVVGVPARVLSFTLSGLPILVTLFWCHYPLQAILNVVIDPFYTAAGVLSIVNVFAVADALRQAVMDFPEQYLIAAKVCGLTRRQTVLKIQFPIILRQTLPTLLIIQVSMLQATLFASLISVDEVFRICQRINAQIYRPVEIYTALGVVFLGICLPLNGLALWLRHRFTRDISER